MQKRSAVLAVAAMALAGCGSTSPTSPSSAPPSSGTATTEPTTLGTGAASTGAEKQPSTSASPCITKAGYAGLYGTVSAFESDHNSVRPAQPTPGIAWYHVLSTTHGCVSAYSVDELSSPPQGARDIVFLTDGIYLPDDHTQPVEKGGCTVFASPTLRRATGLKFAKAVGTAQSGATPAHAEIHLTNNGTC
jgi:hypothetical protein